ncbi:alcohol dehydrogenase catalytic domain-containing protein [Paenibacillus sp. TRM 82003]|nr:alcohol dehydrogenase catalytic domain-containing protein [Paenibacillus sp. TRM 82003]
MKALTYQGVKQVQVKEVEDAKLCRSDDCIVRVTHTSICGSDLHFYHGMIPSMEKDYIIGHEPLGIVEETGRDVVRVKRGDKVVVPFTIACGICPYCLNQLESQCDRANPEGESGAYYGSSRLFGDYAGAQAELLRVPYANFGPFVIPERNEIEDEQLLFLSDCLPTALWSVEHAGVSPGDTVVVLGCGPVGLTVQRLAWLQGAKRVIAVDMIDYRLRFAERANRAETYHLKKHKGDLGNVIKEATGGGADRVIDCVGLTGEMTLLDIVRTVTRQQGGTLRAVQLAAQCVRKGGTIQLTGDYGLRYDGFPLGELFARNITLRMGQAPVAHLIPRAYGLLAEGKLNMADLVSHRLPLDDAPKAYEMFDKKRDECLKIVLRP